VFDELSSRLEGVFQKLRSRGVLGEKQIREGLREVKLALLEADVNYKVVKDFLGRVEERSVGLDRVRGISPGHQVVKIVHEELVDILGKSHREIQFAKKAPTIVLLAGLQGSGKTTTAVKLARNFEKQSKAPYLIAADIYRPAAVEQLKILAGSAGFPVHSGRDGESVSAIVSTGVEKAKSNGADVVIIDSAGRLHCDEEMVSELRSLIDDFSPHETLLVIDGMTGQDAVNIAETFHREIRLSGIILTKMEGDARGGAALSIHGVTGCPIKFIGVGEGIDALEPFHPDRMASRILNKGDIVTLVEKAQQAVDEEELQRVEEKIRGKGEFDFDDFLASLHQLQKMGPMSQLVEMIPGFRSSQLSGVEMDPRQLARVEAIILSMTPEERSHPDILDGSRRLRVARGSGVSVQEVNRLLNQFKGMKKLFKQSGKMMAGKARKKEFKL
jgi:signal recognition particle subunit SRP54